MANVKDLKAELSVLKQQGIEKQKIADLTKQIGLQEKKNAADAAKRVKREADSVKNSKEVLAAERESNSLSKNMNKLLSTQKGKLLARLGILDKSNISRIKELKTQALAELRGKNGVKLEGQKRKNVLNTLKAFNATSDLQKEILADFDAGALQELNAGELKAKVLEKAGISQKEFGKLSEEATADIMNQVHQLESNIKTLNKEGLSEMVDAVSDIEDEFGGLIKKAKTYGGILKSKELRGTALKAGIAAIAFSFAKDLVENAKQLRQELGLSVGEAAKVGAQVTVAQKAMSLMGGDSAQVSSFVTGISQEFGNISEFSTETALQFAKISSTTGLTGSSAAKLAKSIQVIQGGSLETSLNMISTFENMAKTAGVSSKLVLEDIASDAELFAKYGKDGGENIAAAAVQARKLGLNLATVAGAAESLLDFESSITNEMEAEVLLGRSLNLDKARELSLSGDLEGLQKEILKNVGSEAEFNAMNVVQRQALAKSLGMNVADLGKMVAGEKTSAQIQEDQAETQRKQMDMQQVMMATMVGMQGVQAAIVALEAIKNGLLGKGLATRVAGIGASIGSGVGSIFTGLGMVPFGLGIPLAFAAAAGLFALGKTAMGFEKGGMAGVDGGTPGSSDTIPAMLTPGEVVLNAGQQSNVAGAIGGGSGGGAMIDNTALIKTTNQLLTKVNQGINTLIRKTGDQALTS